MIAAMNKLIPYKRSKLDWLLRFAYPDSGGLPVYSQNLLDAYPNTEVLRGAVIDILSAKICRRDLGKKDSIRVLERALNEPIKLLPIYLEPSGEPSWKDSPTIGRYVGQTLIEYLNLPGVVGSVCKRCDKVFLPTRQPKQHFCSTRCRWDYWNEKKMEGYYAAVRKRSREHKQRLKRMKGGKH
jgi:hypothetical protein